ncbi:MAG: YtcA family lipoprotein [Methylomonas sp.]
MKPIAVLTRTATVLVLSLLLTACDPMVSLQGSFWPAWIICILAGLAASMLLMWQFIRLRLAPHLGPPLLIAPSLWALCSFVIWLLFYSR